MRGRWFALASLGVVATVAATAAIVLWAPRPGVTSGITVSGYYTPDQPLVVSNLTIGDGVYRVGYSANVLFLPDNPLAELRCWIVDTAGRIEFFDDGVREVPPRLWTRISARSVYDLPALTLGLRCRPTENGGLTAMFREVTLYATEVQG